MELLKTHRTARKYILLQGRTERSIDGVSDLYECVYIYMYVSSEMNTKRNRRLNQTEHINVC